ncbi:MAG: LysR family transcriptional regulator [Bdellovibrionota bacterium]
MMNLYHLKYFYDAARAGSLVQAARLNGVSHPAISQGIRSLEEKLGVELMVHAKRRFELTTEGTLLLERAAETFEHMDALNAALTSSDGSIRGPLAIGCSHSIGLSMGATTLPPFAVEHPRVDISIRIGNSAKLQELLLTREIEIGIGIDDGNFTRVEKTRLKRGRFILVGKKSKTNPTTFIVGDKGFEVAELRRQLKTRQPDARFIEVQSWELIAQLAAHGLGLGLVPDYLIASAFFPKLETKDVGLKLPAYELCSFVRSQKTLSAQAKAFLTRYAST